MPQTSQRSAIALAIPVVALSPTGPVQQPSLALQQITEGLAPPRRDPLTISTELRACKVLASCGLAAPRDGGDDSRRPDHGEPRTGGCRAEGRSGRRGSINGELVKVRFAAPRAS